MPFRLPTIRQRLSVIGRTGSGKTQFSAWALSHAAFHRQPYVIIDYKYDELLNAIDGVEEISVTTTIPRHPGLYITHPRPDQEEELDRLMWKIWQRERTGVFIDEAHILGKSTGLQAILTQGRSKKIPMIVVTQRPAWVSRFVFSEADFFAVFHLNDRDDQRTVERFVPIDMTQRLQLYHSFYYDVSADRTYRLLPVPDRATILSRFADRMPRRWFMRARRNAA